MKYVIIKPTTKCNFNCTFCSAGLLNIPLQKSVPEVLKNFLLEYKPDSLIITGGEPLINTKKYFDELIDIMTQITPNYSISLTSNLVLWEQNPEKYDYLFKNPHVGVITSFQYGGERKDQNDYNEDRFIELFNEFFKRYGIRLKFIYVVNENNEKYIQKACELAKKLNTKLKLNQQLPLGLSELYYPRYKLIEQHIKMIKLGYEDVLESLISIRNKICPFPLSYKTCQEGKVVYVDNNNELKMSCCEDIISSKDNIELKNDFLSKKCLTCKLFDLCNGCSVNRFYSDIDKQCSWMKEHEGEINEYIYRSNMAL